MDTKRRGRIDDKTWWLSRHENDRDSLLGTLS